MSNSVGFKLYHWKDVITGLLVYGAGDAIAASLANDFSVQRMLSMCVIGALIYGFEIPHYFRWVAKITTNYSGYKVVVLRTLMAMLYFNPLWVARHLAFIKIFSGEGQSVSIDILSVALSSFLTAIPITVIANAVIQNLIQLQYRFLASAVFSCAMAIYYPLISLLFV